MKKLVLLFFFLFGIILGKAETIGTSSSNSGEMLTLTLDDVISMAQENSPSAQSAKHTYLAAEWSYRYFRANYLPSVTLSSSPYLNNEINKITMGDGTSEFVKQNQLSTDMTLKINQNIALTGGSLFLKTSLNRLDELEQDKTSWSSQPVVIGYQQSLFGYNSLKWDKRIEPLRYREAKKNYNEAMQLVAANATSYFFSWILAKSNLEQARFNFANADTLYIMAKGRYSIGSINENELLQLEINRLSDETACMEAEVALEEQTQRLRSYLGLDIVDDTFPQGKIKQQEIRLVMPESVPDIQIDMAEALDLAMENGSDRDYYERQKLEAKSNLAQAKANAGLRADLYMQFGLSQRGTTFQDSYKDPSHQEYVSVTFSLPILDWGRGRGQVRVAKSRLDLINTNAEQGMSDFRQNVQKLVMQFNMQGRKVAIAARTSQQAEHRCDIARRLYVLGRNSVLDLNSAISEKDNARRSHITAIQTYWQLYYTIKSITGEEVFISY